MKKLALLGVIILIPIVIIILLFFYSPILGMSVLSSLGGYKCDFKGLKAIRDGALTSC